jgi:hypothetical protein
MGSRIHIFTVKTQGSATWFFAASARHDVLVEVLGILAALDCPEARELSISGTWRHLEAVDCEKICELKNV